LMIASFGPGLGIGLSINPTASIDFFPNARIVATGESARAAAVLMTVNPIGTVGAVPGVRRYGNLRRRCRLRRVEQRQSRARLGLRLDRSPTHESHFCAPAAPNHFEVQGASRPDPARLGNPTRTASSTCASIRPAIRAGRRHHRTRNPYRA
jgi:hypothetical protein